MIFFCFQKKKEGSCCFFFLWTRKENREVYCTDGRRNFQVRDRSSSLFQFEDSRNREKLLPFRLKVKNKNDISIKRKWKVKMY